MSFAHYLLQVNIYLIVFYGFYKLLLDKETYFTLNRFYLVAAGVLSLVIPFIRLEWLTEQKAAQQVYASVNWDEVLAKATIATESNSGFGWASILVSIYCAGIMFFLGKLVYNLVVVKILIKNAKSGSAFSFFSSKIIDKELPQMDVIDIHEEAHIKQWHTLDILFFELLGILTWLNPIIYFYKRAIKNIHEFLADEKAAEFQGDKSEYALLILSKSFGVSPNSLTNGFFDKSLIKKRIFMLHKEPSKKIAVLKYGIFIPLFAILIVFSSATIRKNEELISITDQIAIEEPIALVQNMVSEPEAKADSAASKTAVEGETNHQWKDFYNFLSQNINYPAEAKESDLQGNTQIKFTVTNGKINNLSNSIDLGKGCDEEVIKAVSAYKGFKTVPNGKYTLKVSFAIIGADSKLENNNIKSIDGYQDLSNLSVTAYSKPTPKTENGDEKVYDFVSIEKQPEFPGGITKFYEYLGKSIKYPELAVENNIQGKVFLSFNVEKNGDLSDIQITRGLGSGTDEEAIRVLSESPKWYPGIQNGKPVRVKYNINVNFKLATEKPISTEKTDAKVSLRFDGTPINSSTAPLIVVDGVKLSSNTSLSTINPNDIESIAVLKNQVATNSYGLSAKNGVILVTTKQAKANLFKKLESKDFVIDKPFDQSIK
ncbi:hypothetical protein DHW03_08315 [Pedobacter yonginense]|uniref:TonB C-terminal domain-containing protein n=1 Tax=Pedobacter yonginense TaxID=651869 RepID=A0A317ELV7_9SPHI|nr:M56 family metallopeptidase [Pedobacter yonginense]PWS27584.1 hypothetical protein DHW03_08315 [Pedobacter yonginense]